MIYGFMHNRLCSPLGKRFVNVAALLSLFSTLFTFAPAFPALAAPSVPLETLSTTLTQPIYSADWDADPTYTNVTYTWTQNHGMIAGSGDPCIAANDCAALRMILEDDVASSTHQHQEWMNTIIPADISLNGPANASVFSVALADDDGNGRYEELNVVLACSDACTFATSTEYSVTIVNYPLKNPEQPINYVDGIYTSLTQYFSIRDNTDLPVEFTEDLTSVVVIGQGVSVTASVDPVLTFSIEGVVDATSFYFDSSDIDTSLLVDACAFGTLTPGVARVCLFTLNINTNAANGYAIYVVQDQDMTYNGNTIKQYQSGTRTDDSAANTWQTPSNASYGHLGYSSNDTSVFPPASGSARWAGIPDIATAGQAPVITGLVADSVSPGDHQYTYALKVESASTLPQAVAASGQAYSHNEYFIVVGNF